MKTIDGLDGNGLHRTYALSMEKKMAAGAFGRARNYGWALSLPKKTKPRNLLNPELSNESNLKM